MTSLNIQPPDRNQGKVFDVADPDWHGSGSKSEKPEQVAIRTSEQTALAELAEQIRAEHQSVIASIRQGARHAMAAGDLLVKAKRWVGHGHFGKWLEANCAISDRTARLYMSLAQNRAAVEAEANRQRVADLTVRGAVKAIAPPTKPKAPKEQPVASTVKRRSRLKPPALNSLLWSDADKEERRKFIDAIGLKAILDVMPESWWDVIEKCVCDRLCREGYTSKAGVS
jgi:hypothetical protein